VLIHLSVLKFGVFLTAALEESESVSQTNCLNFWEKNCRKSKCFHLVRSPFLYTQCSENCSRPSLQLLTAAKPWIICGYHSDTTATRKTANFVVHTILSPFHIQQAQCVCVCVCVCVCACRTLHQLMQLFLFMITTVRTYVKDVNVEFVNSTPSY
jgi:hypothetical protein